MARKSFRKEEEKIPTFNSGDEILVKDKETDTWSRGTIKAVTPYGDSATLTFTVDIPSVNGSAAKVEQYVTADRVASVDGNTPAPATALTDPVLVTPPVTTPAPEVDTTSEEVTPEPEVVAPVVEDPIIETPAPEATPEEQAEIVSDPATDTIASV